MRNACLQLASTLLALCALSAHADQITVLATADSFAVLGASTVTNTGATVLTGDLGLAPGSSITGFGPGTVVAGTTYIGAGVAATAQADALTGYNFLAALAPTDTLTGTDLGGLTLTTGTYFFATSAQLTGALTLDFQNLNDANIVFQIGTTLTTASNSSINVINQGTDDNVYFQVGSSATLGSGSALQGDIIANTSISFDSTASLSCGSAIALNGAVTLIDNAVHNCSTTGSDIGGAADSPSNGPNSGGGDSPAPVPEPESLALLATGGLGGLMAIRRGRTS